MQQGRLDASDTPAHSVGRVARRHRRVACATHAQQIRGLPPRCVRRRGRPESGLTPSTRLLRSPDFGKWRDGARGRVGEKPAAPGDPIVVVRLLTELLANPLEGLSAVQAGQFQCALLVQLQAGNRFRKLERPSTIVVPGIKKALGCPRPNIEAPTPTTLP